MNSTLYLFTKQSATTISVSSHKTGVLSLPVTDLMYLQAYGNYTWLYWKDGRRVLMPRTLKYFLPYIPQHWFVRLHRNCIINIQYVERIESAGPQKGGLVYLTSGTLLLASRRRWHAVTKLLGQYRRRQFNALYA